MIPIKPKLLRILQAQCKGIINIPSLNSLTTSLICTNTAVFVASFFFGGQVDGPTGIKFRPDGDKFYVINSTGFADDNIDQFSCDTFDISQNDPTQDREFEVTPQEGRPTGLAWSDDGTSLFMTGLDSDSIFEYDTSATPFILPVDGTNPKAVVIDMGDPPFSIDGPTGLTFGDNGNKLYVAVGGTGKGVFEILLTSPFTIQAGFTSFFKFDPPHEGQPRSVEWSTDGKKMFITGFDAPATVYQHSVSVAFDLSSTVLLTAQFNLTNETDFPFGMVFSSDGLRMFIVSFSTDELLQYRLPSSFQL